MITHKLIPCFAGILVGVFVFVSPSFADELRLESYLEESAEYQDDQATIFEFCCWLFAGAISDGGNCKGSWQTTGLPDKTEEKAHACVAFIRLLPGLLL